MRNMIVGLIILWWLWAPGVAVAQGTGAADPAIVRAICDSALARVEAALPFSAQEQTSHDGRCGPWHGFAESRLAGQSFVGSRIFRRRRGRARPLLSGRFLGMCGRFWLNWETRFNLDTAQDRLASGSWTEAVPLEGAG